MKYIKRIITIILCCIMIVGSSIPVYASELQKVMLGRTDTVLFEGTYEECITYCDYVKHFKENGRAINPDNTVFELSYSFLNGNRIEFDFERNKMTWIDGSKWDITYTGSLDDEYISANDLQFDFTDDAIRTFCPEFAKTHSLIPKGVPANFVIVLEKAKVQRNARLGIASEPSITTEEQTGVVTESFETFNATDYAERYPDVKSAIGTDKTALWNHYQNMGKAEGRTALFNRTGMNNTSELENTTAKEVSKAKVMTRQENAEYKFERFKKAYYELVNSGDWLAIDCHDCAENLWYSLAGYGMTADGKTMKDSGTAWAMASFYYNQYVNAEGYLYNFSSWMLQQPSSDSIRALVPGLDEAESTNELLMMEAICTISYITSFEKTTVGEVYETTEYVVSGTQSAYAANIILDGVESEKLTAVFDEKGNMLNICSTGFDEYVVTFPR